ncbi:hypothetical protein R3P38DRAFT_3181526 [Favolaschia claudopus]|uniref:Uncharacterized protein n=1 Tax=Favolaschia claudopus TaxID=2862362 RepID=A0AAW0CL64_9AGAR
MVFRSKAQLPTPAQCDASKSSPARRHLPASRIGPYSVSRHSPLVLDCDNSELVLVAIFAFPTIRSFTGTCSAPQHRRSLRHRIVSKRMVLPWIPLLAMAWGRMPWRESCSLAQECVGGGEDEGLAVTLILAEQTFDKSKHYPVFTATINARTMNASSLVLPDARAMCGWRRLWGKISGCDSSRVGGECCQVARLGAVDRLTVSFLTSR